MDRVGRKTRGRGNFFDENLKSGQIALFKIKLKKKKMNTRKSQQIFCF